MVRDAGDSITVDVKGLAGTASWPVDNVKAALKSHFLVFVCYLGKIADLDVAPEVYVVPADELNRFVYTAPAGRRVVPLSRLRNEATDYRNAWEPLLKS